MGESCLDEMTQNSACLLTSRNRRGNSYDLLLQPTTTTGNKNRQHQQQQQQQITNTATKMTASPDRNRRVSIKLFKNLPQSPDN